MNTITEFITHIDEEISRVTSEFNSHNTEEDKSIRDYKLGFLSCLIEVRSYLTGDRKKGELLHD